MKIAILTSGILPVPAVQGGAVEILIDYYLEYNDQHRLHDITVYSVWHSDVKKYPTLKSNVNHYKYIKVTGWIAKLKKAIYKKKHGKEYYHYSIEYFFKQALKHIQKQHFDLIILENRPGFILKLKDKTTARITYHIHNDILNVSTKYASDIYEAATRIITVSNYISSRVKTINCKDTKCITVYNGIDTEAFSRNASPTHLASINDEDFVIIFCGRINKEKGIKELIAAMKTISPKYPIKLLVLGSSFYGNSNFDDTFVQQLKKMAEPIKKRIIFTGFIPYNKMPCYLKLADVAIIPSNWDDPFPTTILEAQAMGLPIITTRRGGIPEEVTEENAILLETDDKFVDNLAAAILDLYEHPEKRVQMSAASLKRSKLFDKETYAKNFFTALEGINKTDQNNTESL